MELNALDPMLSKVDVLNRYPFPPKNSAEAADDADKSGSSDSNTLHVLMYMFPRQFGLHNVFTSVLDNREDRKSVV